MKRQPTLWKKIFACHISENRLIFKIYEVFMQLNSEKKSDLKMSRGPFSKDIFPKTYR